MLSPAVFQQTQNPASYFLSEQPAGHQSVIRSPLKWAGSKTRLIPLIQSLVPVTAQRLVEPFAGSAVVSLNINLMSRLICDVNPDLPGLFNAVLHQEKDYISDVQPLFTQECNTPQVFDQLRHEFNTTSDAYRRAVLFLYLNRHCFNGLCRYNQRGIFNVGYGKYKATYFPEVELHAMKQRLAGADIRVADFRDIIPLTGTGDFVYCDPPYSALTNTANFSQYSKGGFHESDHVDLVHLAEQAIWRGATVVISNNDTPTTRKLYKNADRILELSVSRSISAIVSSRGEVPELMAVFNAKGH